jgi:hypothetical protein
MRLLVSRQAPKVHLSILLVCFCAAWWSLGQPALAVSALFDHPSGLFDQAFELNCDAPKGQQVYFTTNGVAPSPAAGLLWHQPLTVTTTTVLRAASFSADGQVTSAETRSFIFPADVPRQSGIGSPESWGSTNGNGIRATYALDREVWVDPRYRGLIVPALTNLPTLSIILDPEDLWGPGKGIYSHPQESGAIWERAAAVEFIPNSSVAGFSINCGLRIQGGWNRRPEESPKHSFRLVFHHRYGANRLDYPLFGGSGVHEFETLILRAGCNNTWLHWSGEERRRGDYIRDQWMRETLLAMGHPSARGLFVNLYLNGLYWGIYNLVERPSAPFVAANFGGSPKEYDCRNGNHILQGTDNAWQTLMWLVAGEVDRPETSLKISQMIDLPEFIDYMIANLYGANSDWDSASNWYAARRRQPDGQFRFFVWDGERTLEQADANTLDAGDEGSPPGLFQKLRHSKDFRDLFAARVQLHFADGGALTAQAAGQRYENWARKLDLPIVAESARWGGYRKKIHPYKTGPYELYTRDDHWRPEVDRLLHDFFPRRGSELLRQFQQAGLYSTSARP